jgi:hypothetical protein
VTDRPKRTARRTKVETLPEEERLFLRACYDGGMKGLTAVDAYEKKFKKTLTLSAFYSWIARRVLPDKIEAEKAIAAAAEFARLRKEHPDIPEDVLLRGFLRQRLASEEFRQSAVSPEVVIRGELEVRKRDIEERRVKAVEQNNRINRERLELEKQKLSLLREKVRGLREDVGKKKLSGEELQRRLDDLYGITEAKN